MIEGVPDRAVTLQTAARRAGSGCWLATRLFEITGSWVGEVDEPPARVLLDAHGAVHAWHARLWAERLPVLANVDRAELVGPPSARSRRALDALAGTRGTPARLAGVYRVVIPRLLTYYRGYEAQTTAATDGPVRRVLRLVQSDLAEQWVEGEEVLQRLLRTNDDVETAAAHVVLIERELVR